MFNYQVFINTFIFNDRNFYVFVYLLKKNNHLFFLLSNDFYYLLKKFIFLANIKHFKIVIKYLC